MVSDATSSAIQWMNDNISRGSTILPLTYSSENFLSNLASGVNIIPNFQQWWLKDALLTSRPEIILYALTKIGVNYIFATNAELSDPSNGFQEGYFGSTLESFPEVYRNDEVIIYKVPEFPIYQDSNVILVVPPSETDRTNIENAYNLLIASGIKFSIMDSSDLNLHSGFVYIFADNESLAATPQNMLDFIKQGASVVCLGDNDAYYQILNITSSENQIIPARAIPTNSLGGWSIEANSAGNLAIEPDSMLGNALVAENASTDDNGGLIYRYNCSSPLDMSDYSSIDLWFKTNVAGNFYFGLFTDSNNFTAWYGKFDTLYKINPETVNQWVQIVLPINQSTFEPSSGFNLSTVNFIRVGIDGLQPKQKVSFSISEISPLYNKASVDFVDGLSFPVSLSISTVRNPFLGQVLANYTLTDGSKIPYIMCTPIGKGSLISVDSAPLLNVLQTSEYELILNHTGTLLKNLLNMTYSPQEKWDSSFFDNLFEETTYTRFQATFGLAPLAGKILWYDSPHVLGNVDIESNQVYLAQEQLTVKRLDVKNGNENLVFENETLNNVMFLGEGNVSIKSSDITLANSSTDLYSMIYINDNGVGIINMNISKAEVDFQLNTNDGIKHFSLSNVTVTLTLQHSALLLKCKQPTLNIDGNVSGIAQGLLINDGNQYQLSQAETELSGKFDLKIVYSSNVIFSEISRVNELKVQSPIN